MKSSFKLIKETDVLKQNYWRKKSRYTDIVDKCVRELTPGMAFKIKLPKGYKAVSLRNHFYGEKVSHLKLSIYNEIPYVIYPKKK